MTITRRGIVAGLATFPALGAAAPLPAWPLNLKLEQDQAMTDRKQRLLALAERCEQEEPNWDLCVEIELAIRPGARRSPRYGAAVVLLGSGAYNPPPYTHNIDAAATLIPDGMSWEVRRSGFGDPAQAALWDPKRSPTSTNDIRVTHKAGHAALALCAGALRARAASA